MGNAVIYSQFSLHPTKSRHIALICSDQDLLNAGSVVIVSRSIWALLSIQDGILSVELSEIRQEMNH